MSNGPFPIDAMVPPVPITATRGLVIVWSSHSPVVVAGCSRTRPEYSTADTLLLLSQLHWTLGSAIPLPSPDLYERIAAVPCGDAAGSGSETVERCRHDASHAEQRSQAPQRCAV